MNSTFFITVQIKEWGMATNHARAGEWQRIIAMANLKAAFTTPDDFTDFFGIQVLAPPLCRSGIGSI